MDKTNIDFEYSIEQIKREIPSISFPQDKILDSNKMNATFKNMEDSLNTLYENTRYLEDAIDYCHAFLNLRIEEYSQDIKSTLKSIEDIRDINKNASYLEYAIPFRDDASIKKDRDNSIIPTVINKNDYLMLGIKNEKNIEWADIAKKSAYVHYKSNLENISTDVYRTFYIEEKVANKGVVEIITITLKEPTNINYIDIKPVNADIQNFRLVYANGIEDYKEYKSGVMQDAIVAQIKFELVNKKYTNTKYYMQKSKVTDDVWNQIKDFEYKYTLDVNSKLEMEEVIARVQGEKVDIYQTNISNQSDVVEKNMYTYMFGIDSIEIKHIEQEKDSCFISEPININKLRDGEYIQLHTEQVLSETCTVEYSLLDGDIEIDILPYGQEFVKNERLFAALPLRFLGHESETYIIKKDGMVSDISLDDAKLQVLSKFSVDYFPEEKYNYTAINSNVRVKAVIRNYSNQIDSSYIRNIKIRKYGGDTPWTDM